ISTTLLNPYTDLIDDLYLDPIDRDLLIARLERDFKVVLSHEEVARIQTIRDASRFIHLHQAS
ncbi:MAG: phosphopantetheine-binding protein, partial [Bacteroidota bacterium]